MFQLRAVHRLPDAVQIRLAVAVRGARYVAAVCPGDEGPAQKRRPTAMTAATDQLPPRVHRQRVSLEACRFGVPYGTPAHGEVNGLAVVDSRYTRRAKNGGFGQDPWATHVAGPARGRGSRSRGSAEPLTRWREKAVVLAVLVSVLGCAVSPVRAQSGDKYHRAAGLDSDCRTERSRRTSPARARSPPRSPARS